MSGVPLPYVVSAIKSYHLLRKICLGYLYSRDTGVKMEDVLIVRDFPYVFPKDLPSVLIEREIEFRIDIMLGTQPISRAPY